MKNQSCQKSELKCLWRLILLFKDKMQYMLMAFARQYSALQRQKTVSAYLFAGQLHFLLEM